MPSPPRSALLSNRASRVLVVAAIVLSIAIPAVAAFLVTSLGTDDTLQHRLDSLQTLRSAPPPATESAPSDPVLPIDTSLTPLP